MGIYKLSPAMGLWWLLNFTSGRGISALWANCATLPLPRQTGWQPRREARETVLRPPPHRSKAPGVRLYPKQRWPLVRPILAKRLSFLLFSWPPQEPGTHSCLPAVKALPAGMQGRRVKSQNNVLPLPRGLVLPVCLTALTCQHSSQSPPPSGPSYLTSWHSLLPT